MKKITKLINGSIVVFVICLIAMLTLTSCNNTNSNDNLRKGVDNGIVETEEKESDYIVTKEEFDKAVDLRTETNLKIITIVNLKQKNEINTYEYSVYNNYFKMVINGNNPIYTEKSKMENVLNVCNNYGDKIFNNLKYDKQSKSYIAKEIEIQTYYLYNFKLTFKNKQLVGIDVEIYDKETNELFQTNNTIYEYGCVEPFEIPNNEK